MLNLLDKITAIAKDNPETAYYLLLRFIKLVEKNQNFDVAINVAKHCITIQNTSVLCIAIYLFKLLVEKSHGFDAAINALKIAISNPDPASIKCILSLSQALVDKKIGFDITIKAAEAGMASQDINIVCMAIRLFELLVENGHGVDSALRAANFGVGQSDYLVQDSTIDLFTCLVKNGYGFDSAIKLAEHHVNGPLATSILKLLVLNNYRDSFDLAIRNSEALINMPNESLILTGLNLLKEVLKKGYGMQKAESICEQYSSKEEEVYKHLVKELRKEISVQKK